MVDLHFVVNVVQAVLAIACVFGNVLVTGAILRFSKMRTVTDKYILNLSFACFGCAIVVALDAIHASFYVFEWQFSETLCKQFMTTIHINYSAFGNFLAIICVDRYLAIVWPASRTRIVSNVVMTAAWIVSILLTIPTIMYTKLENGSCHVSWPGSAEYNGHYIYYFIQCLVVPLILVVIFNILVAWKLKIFGNFNRSSQIVMEFNRSAVDGDDVNGSARVVGGSNRWAQVDTEVNSVSRKVSIHLIIVTAIWILCSIPYAVCFVVLTFNLQALGLNFFNTLFFTAVIQALTTIMIPVLYALRNDNYRACVWKLLTCADVGDVNAFLQEEISVQRPGVGVTTLQQSNAQRYRVIEE